MKERAEMTTWVSTSVSQCGDAGEQTQLTKQSREGRDGQTITVSTCVKPADCVEARRSSRTVRGARQHRQSGDDECSGARFNASETQHR